MIWIPACPNSNVQIRLIQNQMTNLVFDKILVKWDRFEDVNYAVYVKPACEIVAFKFVNLQILANQS